MKNMKNMKGMGELFKINNEKEIQDRMELINQIIKIKENIDYDVKQIKLYKQKLDEIKNSTNSEKEDIESISIFENEIKLLGLDIKNSVKKYKDSREKYLDSKTGKDDYFGLGKRAEKLYFKHLEIEDGKEIIIPDEVLEYIDDVFKTSYGGNSEEDLILIKEDLENEKVQLEERLDDLNEEQTKAALEHIDYLESEISKVVKQLYGGNITENYDIKNIKKTKKNNREKIKKWMKKDFSNSSYSENSEEDLILIKEDLENEKVQLEEKMKEFSNSEQKQESLKHIKFLEKEILKVNKANIINSSKYNDYNVSNNFDKSNIINDFEEAIEKKEIIEDNISELSKIMKQYDEFWFILGDIDEEESRSVLNEINDLYNEFVEKIKNNIKEYKKVLSRYLFGNLKSNNYAREREHAINSLKDIEKKININLVSNTQLNLTKVKGIVDLVNNYDIFDEIDEIKNREYKISNKFSSNQIKEMSEKDPEEMTIDELKNRYNYFLFNSPIDDLEYLDSLQSIIEKKEEELEKYPWKRKHYNVSSMTLNELIDAKEYLKNRIHDIENKTGDKYSSYIDNLKKELKIITDVYDEKNKKESIDIDINGMNEVYDFYEEKNKKWQKFKKINGYIKKSLGVAIASVLISIPSVKAYNELGYKENKFTLFVKKIDNKITDITKDIYERTGLRIDDEEIQNYLEEPSSINNNYNDEFNQSLKERKFINVEKVENKKNLTLDDFDGDNFREIFEDYSSKKLSKMFPKEKYGDVSFWDSYGDLTLTFEKDRYSYGNMYGVIKFKDGNLSLEIKDELYDENSIIYNDENMKEMSNKQKMKVFLDIIKTRVVRKKNEK